MEKNEKINGWTFEEAVKNASNLMEVESNMYKWDVLRHLLDFTKAYREELKEYHAIGTPEECRTSKEKQTAKKVKNSGERVPFEWYCPVCGNVLCDDGYKDTEITFKPILFNTEMVRAILDGRKSCTRRVVKPQPTARYGAQCIKPPYQPGDILYVRETFYEDEDCILYKADNEKLTGYRNMRGEDIVVKWHPSIHMPKEAARIWLKVTSVRVERLQEITPKGAENEGVGNLFYEDIGYSEKNYGTEVDPEYGIAKEQFAWLWESTIKKSDIDRYGWNANPYVWVISFERCEKPKGV